MAGNEEISNLVVKLSTDTTGFQSGVSELNREMAIVKQEFRLASSQLGDFSNSSEQLNLKANSLGKQLDIQKQKVEALSRAYEESRQKSGENTKATDDLKIKLLRAQRQEAELENQLKQTNSALKEQKSGFAQAGEHANKFGGILRNAFSVTLGIAFTDMLRRGFDYAKEAAFGFNSSLQQNKIAFETMLGSAKEANEYIQGMMEYSARTPFEFTDLAEGSKLLMAFGFEAEKLPGMIEAIGNAAAGLGMSGKEGLQRIGLQLGQMQTQGKATYQDLKQLAQAGVPVWDILSQSIGKSTGELQDMVSKGMLPAAETIDVLIAGMNERFPNMMEKQSKSWQGLMSSIKDNISIALGTATQELFESLSGHLENVSNKLQEFNAVVKDEGLRAGLETLIPKPLVDGLAVIKNMFSWIIEHGAITQSVVVGIGAAFATIKLGKLIVDTHKTIKAFNSMQNVFKLTIGKAAAVSAVVAVVAGVAYLLYRNWENVAPFFKSMWDAIVNVFKWADSAIGVVLAGLQVGLAETLRFILGNTADWVSGILGLFSHIPKIGDEFAKAQAGVNKFSTGLDNFVKTSKGAFKEALSDTKNYGSEIKKSFGEMTQAGSKMTNAIGDDLSGMVDKAKNSFKGLGKAPDEAIEGFDTSILEFEEAGENLTNAIGKGAEKGSKSAKAKVKKVVEGISDEMNTAVYLIDREIKKLLDDDKDLEQYQINLAKAMELTAQKAKLLESEFERLSKVKNVNKETLNQLTKEIENTKNAYDELGRKLVDVSEKIKQANIKTANDFVEQIKGALKRRYEEEKELREANLNDEIKALDDWKDESVKRINDVYEHKIKVIEESSNTQIEALNRELQALDKYEKDKSRAEQDKEDLDKINRLKDAIDYEHNEFNKAQLKKELGNAEKDFAKRKEQEKLDDRKQAIKQEIADIREKARQETEILKAKQQEELTSIQQLYQANKDTLQQQLKDLREFYKIKTKDAELQAEAEYMIMHDLQDDMIDLLYQYTDHYKAVGQTFGDKMVEGFAPMIDEIHGMIDGVLERISAARSAALSIPVPNISNVNYRSNTSFNAETPNSITNPDGSRDWIWPDGRREPIVFNTTINSPVARTPSQERREVERSQRNMVFQAGLA